MISIRQDNDVLILNGDLNGYEFNMQVIRAKGETPKDTLRRMQREYMVRRFRIQKRIDRVNYALENLEKGAANE